MFKKSTQLKLTFAIVLGLCMGILFLYFPGAQEEDKDKLALVTSLTESPYQVEVKIFRLPKSARGMKYFSYGLNMGKDGFLYFGVGDNQENAHFLRFDPVTEHITDLGNFKDTLPEEIFSRGNYGKFHVGPYQDFDGTVYFASYAIWEKASSGRLFKYTEELGVVDLGPTPNNQAVYFMHGDDTRRKLYLATRDSHFSIYDIETGVWDDRGKFTSKPPFSGVTDKVGRLYMYGYDGKGDWGTGPPTITRYDPVLNTLETSKNAPPTLWTGVVSPDNDIVYTTNYKKARIFRWRLSDWPAYQYDKLGLIDPAGHPVYSNNLSLTLSKKQVVLAGTILTSKWLFWKSNLHGVWTYEIESGKKYRVANLGKILSESLGIDVRKRKIYWTNANTVDKNGWIYIGLHTLPFESVSMTRLMAIRVKQKGSNEVSGK